MIVLVDTSVWIRALSNREPCKTQLDRLLSDHRVLGHELVYGEILIGDNGGRQATLNQYGDLAFLQPQPNKAVVELVRSARLHGRGIGWIDAHLLAAAVVFQVSLWSADARLAAVADELGVGYRLTN